MVNKRKNPIQKSIERLVLFFAEVFFWLFDKLDSIRLRPVFHPKIHYIISKFIN